MKLQAEAEEEFKRRYGFTQLNGQTTTRRMLFPAVGNPVKVVNLWGRYGR